MILFSPGTGEEWPWIHVVMFSQHTVGNGNVFHVRPNVGHRPRLSPSYPTTSSLPSSPDRGDALSAAASFRRFVGRPPSGDGDGGNKIVLSASA